MVKFSVHLNRHVFIMKFLYLIKTVSNLFRRSAASVLGLHCLHMSLFYGMLDIKELKVLFQHNIKELKVLFQHLIYRLTNGLRENCWDC